MSSPDKADPQASTTFPRLPDPVCSISIENAGSGLGYILQSGALIPCTVNIPLTDLLRDACRLTEEQLAKLDVFLLDGKPVDSPTTTPVHNGARLALAAGLPGIAGLAMKSDSAVKGLRPGITHPGTEDPQARLAPCPGHVEIVLYSLALKQLAEHFLRIGVILPAVRLLENLDEPGSSISCSWDGQAIPLELLRSGLSKLPPKSLIAFRASA